MFLVLGLLGGVVLVLVAAIIVLTIRSKSVEVVNPTPPQSQTARSPEELVRAGKKLEAVKRYRELHRVDLKRAKEAVEALADGGSALPPKGVMLRQVNDSDIEHQIRTGHLIDAIKLYREKTGVGLKEAKDAVEAMRHRMRAS